MMYTEEINKLTQQINQMAMNILKSHPAYQNLMGQLEVYQKVQADIKEGKILAAELPKDQ